MERACRDCMYYDNGTCRNAPPIVTTASLGTYWFFFRYSATMWPEVNEKDWCGYFINKETLHGTI